MRRVIAWCLCLSLVGAVVVGCGGSSNNNNNNTNANNNNQSGGTLQLAVEWGSGAAKKGQNDLIITVTDKDGKAVEKAEVTVDPQMPSMGHGSSEQAKVEEMGQGKYKATPVTFQMGGEWEVTIAAKKGEETGRQTFKLTVQ